MIKPLLLLLCVILVQGCCLNQHPVERQKECVAQTCSSVDQPEDGHTEKLYVSYDQALQIIELLQVDDYVVFCDRENWAFSRCYLPAHGQLTISWGEIDMMDTHGEYSEQKFFYIVSKSSDIKPNCPCYDLNDKFDICYPPMEEQ
jgi:hypothetical protein